MSWHSYFTKKQFAPGITLAPESNLGLCVVIPSYNELNLSKALGAIGQCKLPPCSVEVIVVVNHPENSSLDIIKVSEQTVNEVEEAQKKWGNTQLKFHAIRAYNLPRKHAGVGLARQIGMDEAAYRLMNVSNPNGVIACFDADSECEPNYLTELHRLWQQFPKTHACSVRYEHPLHGSEYPPEVYNGIAAYELHLRYYNQASRFVGFPFAYHTVGSSMAVCAEAYILSGGMNRHQAGEDFYFLQKIIQHGRFRELNSTCVYPSPRPSNRVPFGTGRAMSKLLFHNEPISTYSLDSFMNLLPFFLGVDEIYPADEQQTKRFIGTLAEPLKQYLLGVDAVDAIANSRANASSLKSFKKRFFLWFNAFMLLKYMNFAAENYYGRLPVEEQASRLLECLGIKKTYDLNTKDLLLTYREMERMDWHAIL